MARDEVADLPIDETGPRVFITDAAMVDVSATTIRAAVQSGDRESLRAMTPPAVADYIEKYGLYKTE
jgi:nicotinic acid mononucleotide adenylyltransferase